VVQNTILVLYMHGPKGYPGHHLTIFDV